MVNFIVRTDWKCDVQYRTIVAKDYIEAMGKVKKKYNLTDVNQEMSSSLKSCSLYRYSAKFENSYGKGTVFIEVVEIRKDIS